VGTNHAVYKKGYETGVASVTFPSDLSDLIAASTSGGRQYAGDIWVTLSGGTAASGDGYAVVRATASGPAIDTVWFSNPSFNGVILGTGRVNVQGTVDGRVTIASRTDVYIQNDIVYEQDPLAGSSDDLLGLVADQNVMIADNAANNSNCVVDAAIFARSQSFAAENLTGRPYSGNLQVLGSIIQKNRGEVAKYSGSTLSKGFYKRYRFDDRLQDPSFRPPYFPGFYVKTLAITNWWESYRISAVQ
jgi:hypothetical protein